VDSTELFIGALMASLLLIALVSIVGGFLAARRSRMLTHQERMKALELGRDMPDDAATARIKAAFGTTSSGDGEEEGSLPRKCFSTAIWIAFWGFIAASQGGWVNHAIAIAIAVSTGAICVTAVICGTILASRTPALPISRIASKPIAESDAYDVVSRRG
jgi:hypothetical protein